MSPHYSRQEIEELARRYRTWNRWGEADELGHLNFVTPDVVTAAAALVTTGRTFQLAMSMDRDGPMTGAGITGRANIQHFMTRDGGDVAAGLGGPNRFDGTDDAVLMHLQSSTQWDGLAHVFYDGVMYGGRPPSLVTSQGAQVNSVTSVLQRPVTRGVLLDIPRHRGVDWLEPGDSIEHDELEACAASVGVTVRTGDAVIVRTGELARCRSEQSWGTYAGGTSAGLGVSAAHFLCQREVSTVASDNWGLDVNPYQSPDVRAPLHVVLLVNAGVHIGEMWDLEVLAEDCASDGRYEFMLAAAPLNITGAVGSPVSPVAVK